MSEENALSIQDAISGALSTSQSKFADAKAVALVSQVGDFFPYVKINQGNTEPCMTGKLKPGEMTICSGKQETPIGLELVSLLCGWRPKAMQYKPETLSFYNPATDEFKSVQAKANAGQNSNCGFGAEYLIWSPAMQMFVVFFFGNASGRISTPQVINCFQTGSKICKIVSTFMQNSKGSWFGPVYQPHDLPIEVNPDLELLQETLKKFNNPPTVPVREAAGSGSSERD